jgi:hypothetical protein
LLFLLLFWLCKLGVAKKKGDVRSREKTTKERGKQKLNLPTKNPDFSGEKHKVIGSLPLFLSAPIGVFTQSRKIK